ncbi:auxin-repressed protein [Musa troglodytarum]|uniref:Auxin-repressed protein n=1 Tax=Musa troglodytarum TaxID=320322 RepID=A0A9E7EHS4_9LILI|nr:auxin-repressed protein [Musa troglodytarum]
MAWGRRWNHHNHAVKMKNLVRCVSHRKEPMPFILVEAMLIPCLRRSGLLATELSSGAVPSYRRRIMGLLDKLWDDTLAGPRPETGLGRLRKHSSFCFRSNSGGKAEGAAAGGGIAGSDTGGGDEVAVRVTRSIMIKRPAGCPSPGNATPPASPAGSTPPISPFSGESFESFIRGAGSGTDLEGNHRLMHMKEWDEEEEWWASEHRMLLLLMRFELC